QPAQPADRGRPLAVHGSEDAGKTARFRAAARRSRRAGRGGRRICAVASVEGARSMGITVTPLHPLFVGEVSGVDAGRPLDPETARALTRAIDRYAVLVLREQNLDDERQMAFA